MKQMKRQRQVMKVAAILLAACLLITEGSMMLANKVYAGELQSNEEGEATQAPVSEKEETDATPNTEETSEEMTESEEQTVVEETNQESDSGTVDEEAEAEKDTSNTTDTSGEKTTEASAEESVSENEASTIEDETNEDETNDGTEGESLEEEIEEELETSIVSPMMLMSPPIPASYIDESLPIEFVSSGSGSDYQSVNTFILRTPIGDRLDLIEKSEDAAGNTVCAQVNWFFEDPTAYDYLEMIHDKRQTDGTDQVTIKPNGSYIPENKDYVVRAEVSWSDGRTETYKDNTIHIKADDANPDIGTSITLEGIAPSDAIWPTPDQYQGTLYLKESAYFCVSATEVGSVQSGISEVWMECVDASGNAKPLQLHKDEQLGCYTIHSYLLRGLTIKDIVATDKSGRKGSYPGIINLTTSDGVTNGDDFDYTITSLKRLYTKASPEIWFSKHIDGDYVEIAFTSKNLITLTESMTGNKFALLEVMPGRHTKTFIPVTPPGWEKTTLKNTPSSHYWSATYDNIPLFDEGAIEYALNYEYSSYGVKQSKAQALTINVDNTEPGISVAYGHLGLIEEEPAYSNQSVNITVSFNDKNVKLTDGNGKNLTYINVVKSDSNGAMTTETITSGNGLYGATWNPNGEGGYTVTFKIDDDGVYYIEAVCEDKAGNTKKYNITNLERKKFIIDAKEPDVEITFDHEDAAYRNYYKKNRVATITVTEKYFDANNVQISIDAEDIDGNTDTLTPAKGNWTHQDDKHFITVTFSQDGRYNISASASDLAGNKSKTATAGEFIIDTTGPQITVRFDRNEARNEIYYSSNRMATVIVKDFGFNDSSMEMVNGSDVGIKPAPSMSTFEGEGTVKSASIAFEEDGRYSFSLKCTDYVGNSSGIVTVQPFVIDTTKPTILFDRVGHYSANKGDVAPVIHYQDANIEDGSYIVSIKGANRGEVTMPFDEKAITNGKSFSFDNVPRQKKYDDLYTMTAQVTDLAGNVTEETLVYSVNRFGSVYIIADKTKAMMEVDFVTEPEEVTITEINVDSLTKKEVTVSRDGDAEILEQGSDYTVKSQGNDQSWKSFTYTIPKSYFKQDGYYAVKFASVDRATNAQDNRTRDAAIDFAIDRTAPSIVVTGLASKSKYEGGTHEFLVNVTDNMALKDLQVYINDELFTAYDSDALARTNGTQEVSIPSSDKEMTIRLTSSDGAGNLREVKYEKVKVLGASIDEARTIEDSAVPLAINQLTGKWYLYLIAILLICAITGGYKYYVHEKKKNEKN